MVLFEETASHETGGAPFAMPDFYEYLQRPLGGGDLLTVPRGLYHLPRRPLLLSDWPPFSPAAALPPAHFYYGYYATAAAGLVSTYLRESTTSQGAGSWVERPPAATNSGVALQRRLHARGRRSLHLHSEVVTSSQANVAAAAVAAAPDGTALAAASARSSNVKCLGDDKRAIKANERWAAFNKQTYEKIVDATLKEMTSSTPSCDDKQRTDDDEDEDSPEEYHKSPLAGKGHLQLARSITPIFRRSPGASRVREGLLRNRGHKGKIAPLKQEGKERAGSPLEGKGRTEESEPLDLSTHSGRAAGDLLDLMVCHADEQESAPQPPRQGLSVQALHNWQSVRHNIAPTDPAAATAMATPRAVWVRAQTACQAHSADSHCQLLSSAPDRAGDGRSQPEAAEYRADKRDTDYCSLSVTDATPQTGQAAVASRTEESREMSSGVAMSSHGGLRAKEDLWVPLNKDTVLGLVNDVVDSMVSSDLSDRPYSGAQRSGPRTSDSERTSTPPTPRLHPRGMRRTPNAPSTAKHSAVMDSQPTSLSCPAKSTSQKENMHRSVSTRTRPPTSPAKGPTRAENVDRWVAITKLAMRDIVENAIRCELAGEDTATTPSDDRSDAPDTCSKSKPEGQVNDVDYNANERPPSPDATSSQDQSSSGRASQKRTRSPSPRSPASSCEGNKRTKGEEVAIRSPLKSPLDEGSRSPVPEKLQTGGRRTPPDDTAKGDTIASHAAKGPSRPARASPPCTGPRRMPRTLDNPPTLRPASLPPPPVESSSRDRRAHSQGAAFKAPQVSGPISAHEARRQLTAWVAVSKNMVNSMIEDILVDKTDNTETSVTSRKTSDSTSDSTSSDSSQGYSVDLSVDQTKSCSNQSTGDQCTGDQSETSVNSPPPPVVPSASEQEQRPLTPRSPTSSPETETTDSTSSSDHVTSSSAICKSSFKLKSAMLERFNEERKSSTSSPSLPSPVTSSSPSVTPSPSLTARSTPSPSSPATSKVKQTLSVSCDQEKVPKGPIQNCPSVAQKQGPKSKKGPRSRQTTASVAND